MRQKLRSSNGGKVKLMRRVFCTEYYTCWVQEMQRVICHIYCSVAYSLLQYQYGKEGSEELIGCFLIVVASSVFEYNSCYHYSWQQKPAYLYVVVQMLWPVCHRLMSLTKSLGVINMHWCKLIMYFLSCTDCKLVSGFYIDHIVVNSGEMRECLHIP